MAALVRPGCVGAIVGLAVTAALPARWSAFVGLAVFYLALVLRDGGSPARGDQRRD